jgi:hypothetical protein
MRFVKNKVAYPPLTFEERVVQGKMHPVEQPMAPITPQENQSPVSVSGVSIASFNNPSTMGAYLDYNLMAQRQRELLNRERQLRNMEYRNRLMQDMVMSRQPALEQLRRTLNRSQYE